ncbi:hypothetical protein BN1723_008342 [Verticillium longisporum]|uniref:PRISE-like Rossmann-fold domain-containing protein n=1 Tax=Verticillium longisporum TaxID=100787 RepID=A0A0G4NRA7_VERLO|nr:hypothetical protein BN1723_008342 [Verticillium longisporum]
MTQNHALIYGASGITGWSITNALLEGYPSKDTFASVTALTNRPLDPDAAFWPNSEKLQIASGVDILTSKGQDGLEADLKAKVKNIANISHVYFFAYIMDTDPAKECSINKELIKRAVSADIVARVCIYASLHPETTAEQRYNATDNSQPSSWSEKWPVICEYFGLKGTAPPPGGSGPQPAQYLAEHFDDWKALEEKYGLVSGRVGNDRSFGPFAHFIITMLDFDRQMDLSKCHEMWGSAKEEIDTKTSWWTTLDRFRKAKIIP